MQGRRGMAWLAGLGWLALIICLPGLGQAAIAAGTGAADSSNTPPAVAAPSSLDAQTMGEKPLPSSTGRLGILQHSAEAAAPSGGATLHLPHNLEMRISFLYKGEAQSLDPRKPGDSLPLFNYSMDYRLFPNFKVGLSGYLYHPYPDQPFSLNRPFGERVLGGGPALKYDLGRWSIVVKSQMETGTRDKGDDFQNWLRVWYAF